MGAAREEFLRRSVVAGLASTVVISLTALTAGTAPAVADPDTVVTTTAQAPSGSTDAGGQGRGGEAQQEPTSVEPVVTQTSTPAVTQEPIATQEPTVTQEPVVVDEPVVTQAPAQTPSATVAPQTVAPKPTPTPQPATQQPTVEQPVITATTRPSAPASTSPASPAEPSAEPAIATTTKTPTTTVPTPTTTVPTTEPTTEPTTVPTGTSAPKPVERQALTTGPSTEAPAATDPTEGATAAKPAQTEPSESSAPDSSDTESTESADAPTAEAPRIENAAKVIETLEPEVLDAPVADVRLASNATPVEVNPAPAKVEDLAQLSSLIGISDQQDRLDEGRRQLREDQRELREDQRQLREDQRELRAEQRDWDRRVRQWSPDWVQYDEFYRPMIVNPYRDPVRIVYEYQDRPRVVTIPPLQRMVMYVADLAAYSFTAVVLNTVNTVVSTAVGVAVGSFFGGGFIPTIANVGAITPPPPPPLFRYDNVPVQVRYSDAVYEPFRVQRIVDVGDDARYGERRVLLDGVTPAWGVWKQNASGERQFEVHRTQQYPGLDTPREGPLPGDYRMTLASDEAPTGTGGQTGLIIAAVACAVLSLGAVGAAGLLGRRRGV